MRLAGFVEAAERILARNAVVAGWKPAAPEPALLFHRGGNVNATVGAASKIAGTMPDLSMASAMAAGTCQ